MRARVTLLFVAPLLATIAGCAGPIDDFAPRLGDGGDGYNRALVHDVVVNVLRAGADEPTTFVGAGKFTAARNFDLKAALPTINLSAGPTTTSIGGNSLDLATNAQVEATALNTESFTRGFLSPVPLQTVKFLIDQGYPRELLLHLLVSGVRIRDAATGSETLYRNDPDLDEGEDCPDYDYTGYANRGEPSRDDSPYGPAAKSAGCEYHHFEYWVEEGMRYGVNVEVPDAKQAAVVDTKKGEAVPKAKPAAQDGSVCYDLSLMSGFVQGKLLAANPRFKLTRDADSPICGSTHAGPRKEQPLPFVARDGRRILIFLNLEFRSPASAFGYLGRLAAPRASARPRLFERSFVRSADPRLFVLEAGRTQGCLTVAAHGGIAYCLPLESRTSKAAVSVLASLVQLNTSRDDVPTNTTSVNISP